MHFDKPAFVRQLSASFNFACYCNFMWAAWRKFPPNTFFQVPSILRNSVKDVLKYPRPPLSDCMFMFMFIEPSFLVMRSGGGGKKRFCHKIWFVWPCKLLICLISQRHELLVQTVLKNSKKEVSTSLDKLKAVSWKEFLKLLTCDNDDTRLLKHLVMFFC